MKITIDLNEKQAYMLEQYADVYNYERELDTTSDPIVVVEERESISAEPDYGDQTIYVLEGEREEFECVESLLKFYEIEDIDACVVYERLDEECAINSFANVREDLTIGKFYVYYGWKPKAFFLTRKEADNYRNYQSHNLRKSRAYTRNCGYANVGDLLILRTLLLNIGNQIKGGHGLPSLLNSKKPI